MAPGPRATTKPNEAQSRLWGKVGIDEPPPATKNTNHETTQRTDANKIHKHQKITKKTNKKSEPPPSHHITEYFHPVPPTGTGQQEPPPMITPKPKPPPEPPPKVETVHDHSHQRPPPKPPPRPLTAQHEIQHQATTKELPPPPQQPHHTTGTPDEADELPIPPHIPRFRRLTSAPVRAAAIAHVQELRRLEAQQQANRIRHRHQCRTGLKQHTPPEPTITAEASPLVAKDNLATSEESNPQHQPGTHDSPAGPPTPTPFIHLANDTSHGAQDNQSLRPPPLDNEPSLRGEVPYDQWRPKIMDEVER